MMCLLIRMVLLTDVVSFRQRAVAIKRRAIEKRLDFHVAIRVRDRAKAQLK